MGAPDAALDSLSDEALVRRVRARDETALSVLYRRHVAAIYRFVLAQVRSESEAEDLTSDTFARMLRGLEGFRGEASFRNWLYQIARNVVRNHRRSARYRLDVPLSPLLAASDGDTGEPVAEADGGLADEVLAILQGLPPRYRQVLELRFLAGRSLEDVAAQMGITVANVKVLQHRALRKAAAALPQMEERVGAGSTGR